ncbi:MAG: PE-PGRS family protein [Dactylosporangium sp.]|nr:2-oxo acid dehydrogenase subunit E2 [Dactylosporangium sp.]NNJ63456.1 PE-PGRS family protein [Dactylosporangium sp.]
MDSAQTADGSPQPPRQRVALHRSQRAVAAVVAESHRTIPSAFAAVRVQIDSAIGLGRELTRREHCLIGLPELLVKAVASLRPQFVLCFATLVGDDGLELAESARIGVTVEVGSGMSVPVLPDAEASSWRQVATTLMEFRLAAMRGGLLTRELVGANIVLAVHSDPDVTVVVPMVFPGQVCAVSLGGPQNELAFTEDGTVTSRSVVQLGIAYDHRVINAREALSFLQAIKALLESPEALAPLG